MCIGGNKEITTMIGSVNERKGNLKFANYKINTYKTEWNGLLRLLICPTNE